MKKTGNVARAMVSGIYDVMNDIMIVSKIARSDASERDLAMELIEALKERGLKNDLILFDRGYPSAKFIAYCEHSGIKYVMRVSSMFIKAVSEAKKADQAEELTNVFTESWETKEFKEPIF